MLSLYGPTFNKVEFVPHCLPNLPEILTPKAAAVRKVILQVAEIFGATDKFIFSGEMTFAESRQSEVE